MQRNKVYGALIIFGLSLTVASATAVLSVQSARAQCGSQASSCKNCHETQAKDPVNTDGTGWHQSHAFGDFCYICHGGNSQSLDETTAHTGMVDPMSDIQTACGQCHASDLQTKAGVYAAALGKPLPAAASTSPAPVATPAAPSAATAPTEAPPPAPASLGAAPPAGSPDLVDYVQRYDQNVRGERPVNVGNVILIILIAAMVIGGGGLIIRREGLVRISFKETMPIAGEYPSDLVDMVPDLAKLKPAARRSLQRMLKNPAATAGLLDAVERLTKDQDEDVG